jgi:hypothetical protein
VHGAISVLFGGAQSSCFAQTHKGAAQRKRKTLNHSAGINNAKTPAEIRRIGLWDVLYSSASPTIYISTKELMLAFGS